MKNFKKRSLYCIVILLMAFTACDKKENEKTILLTAFNFVSDNSFDKNELEYNASNQLVKVVNTYSYGDDIEELIIEFKYNEQGQFIEDIATSDDGYVQKTLITRDGNIIKYNGYSQAEDGSWVDELYGEVITLNDVGQVVETKFFSGWNNGDVTFEDSVVYTWENENVTNYKMFNINTPMLKHAQLMHQLFFRSVYLASTQKSVKSDSRGTITMEYDDKLNPLSLLAIDYSWECNVRNNAVSEKREYENGNTSTYTYTYEYNENDYPDKVVASYNGEEEQVITYKYKEL